METRDYFNRRAVELEHTLLIDKWDAIGPLLVGFGEGARLLECGAGTGLYTLPFLAKGFCVTAVDLSEASLGLLRSAADKRGLSGRLTTLVGDFNDMASSMPSVDVLAFIKVLHHFPDKQSIEKAIRLGWSRVESGGRMIIFEPNGKSPVWPVLLRLRGADSWKAEKNTLLMRREFFGSILEGLPGAKVSEGSRYLVPGTLATKSRAMDQLDRTLCAVPVIRSVAANIWYTIDKQA